MEGLQVKAKEAIEILSRYSPEDELCILWWDKPQFDNLDEMTLTDEGWGKICKEFDAWDNAGQEVTEWINDATFEHMEEKP